jgi:hypothetical protein
MSWALAWFLYKIGFVLLIAMLVGIFCILLKEE